MISAELKAAVDRLAEEHRQEYEAVAHEVFVQPEPGMQEYHAVRYLTGLLKENGFRVTCPYGGLETAFLAEYGEDRPRIAFLAEYDALPGYGPNKDQWGHACGHNWIAANAFGACDVLRRLHDDGLIRGTICYVGCPAEETVGGKVNLTEAGCFDDMDAAMQIHIARGHGANLGNMALAMNSIEFIYTGVSSHAASAPERGVNALDAAYLTFNGINALRQHVTPDVRMHGVIDQGGLAPNVVPALASARWYIRAAERNYLDELEQKVIRCAEGACLMTGAKLDWRYFENRYDNYVRCPELTEAFAEALHLAGETTVLTEPQPASGSTDIGNVSRVCPTGYCELGIGNEDGYDVHEEEFLQYCDGPAAYAGLNRAVRTQAYLAAVICTDPQLQTALQAFKQELKRGNGK